MKTRKIEWGQTSVLKWLVGDEHKGYGWAAFERRKDAEEYMRFRRSQGTMGLELLDQEKALQKVKVAMEIANNVKWISEQDLLTFICY